MFESSFLSSICVVRRLVQVRRVYLDVPRCMLPNFFTHLTDFFTHLTEFTFPNITYSPKHLDFYISLMRRGVKVDTGVWLAYAHYEFYFGSSQSLDFTPFSYSLNLDMAALKKVTQEVDHLNIKDYLWGPSIPRKSLCLIIVNVVLSMLASKDRRGRLTEVSIAKVTLLDNNIF